MQNNIIRIVLGCKKKGFVQESIQETEDITFGISVYTFSLRLVIKNNNQFIANSEIYSVDTRQHTNFHQPTSNLTKYRKGICYSRVTVYNNLPLQIKDIYICIYDDPTNFELQLKQFFFYLHSLYSLEEYFHYKYLLRY